MNYYISDLHFGHANIIGFDKRPFINTKEMDEELIKRWNSVVTPSDNVYILGDFCWSKSSDEWVYYLNKLNGQKFLIKGNHDPKLTDKAKKKFAQICDYKEVKENGKTIILSHYPMLTYRSDYRENVYMFYGHVHKTKEADIISEMISLIKNKPEEYWQGGVRPYANLYNVGCMLDYMDYTPRTADEIISASK